MCDRKILTKFTSFFIVYFSLKLVYIPLSSDDKIYFDSAPLCKSQVQNEPKEHKTMLFECILFKGHFIAY